MKKQKKQQQKESFIKKHYEDFIFLTIKRGIKMKVFLNEILYCKAANSYTSFHLIDNTEHIISHTLKEIEEFLSEYGFYRINRSYIINPVQIKILDCNNKPSIILTDETKIDISTSKIKEIEAFLHENFKCFTK